MSDSSISYDGLPSVRFKKVKHVGEMVVEEMDFYVQDHKISNALKVLGELLKLNKEVDSDE